MHQQALHRATVVKSDHLHPSRPPSSRSATPLSRADQEENRIRPGLTGTKRETHLSVRHVASRISKHRPWFIVSKFQPTLIPTTIQTIVISTHLVGDGHNIAQPNNGNESPEQGTQMATCPPKPPLPTSSTSRRGQASGAVPRAAQRTSLDVAGGAGARRAGELHLSSTSAPTTMRRAAEAPAAAGV